MNKIYKFRQKPKAQTELTARHLHPILLYTKNLIKQTS